MAVMQLKDGRWICYYRMTDPETGRAKQRREYFGRGESGRQAAERKNASLGLQKRRPQRPHMGPTFASLAEEYAMHAPISGNTLSVLRWQLTANIIPRLGHRMALGLRHKDLDHYVADRRRTVSDSTIRRELTAIQAILNWSVSRNPPLIPNNPVATYRKPRAYDAVIPPPTADEVALILTYAVDHLRRAILLSYYLGLRPGCIELLSLRWSAVSQGRDTVTVTSAHKGGAERREVPIHPELVPIIDTWRRTDPPTSTHIIHYHGRPIRSIKSAWRNALRRAGITRRIRPYDIRHAFATAALEREGDIKALSEIMGSRPETLMRFYQHVSSSLRRQTVSKIPAISLPPHPWSSNYDQKPKKKAARKSGLTC